MLGGFRWFLGLVLILLIALAVIHVRGRESTLGPRARIDVRQHDFGGIPIGTELAATFQVRNDGSRRLILNEQGACCGAALETIIAPRQTQNIVVPIQTGQLRPGPVRESVIFETNDPRNPILEFTVSFDAAPGS